MLEAERQFRKIIGYRDLVTLVVAIERDHDRCSHTVDAAHTPTKETAIVHRLIVTPGPPPKIHGARDILRSREDVPCFSAPTAAMPARSRCRLCPRPSENRRSLRSLRVRDPTALSAWSSRGEGQLDYASWARHP
jgi:hypothetical protein